MKDLFARSRVTKSCPRKVIRLFDMFCGAGGTSTGAIEAAQAAGFDVTVQGVNHWDIACATFRLNHPDQPEPLCKSVDNVDARGLISGKRVHGIIASPECTHHSNAAGGRPINDQSRATAWCVVRMMEALMPDWLIMENVPEFANWGGIDRKGRPLRRKRGQTFRAFVSALESLGYKVAWRVLTAADYGDPTTRSRLILQAVRGRGVCFPAPTHGPDTSRPWKTAEDSVIDWALEGKSIFTRKRGLVVKSMRRILVGLERFALEPFLVGFGGPTNKGKPRSVKTPVSTVLTESHDHLVKTFILPHAGKKMHWDQPARSVDKPLNTVTATHGAGSVVKSFIVEHRGTSDAQIDASARTPGAPISAVATSGGHHSIAKATFLVQMNHGNGKCGNNGDKRRVRATSEPLPTVCGARGEWAKCSAILQQQSGGVARDTGQPMPTVAAQGAIGKADYIITIDHQTGAGGQGNGVRSVRGQLSTISTKARHSLISPFLVRYNGTGTAEPLGRPVPTVTATDRFAFCRPSLKLVESGGDTFRRVDYWAWKRLVLAQSAKGRPLTRLFIEIEGVIYMIEITHRMLQVHELAAAQGFRPDYVFTGNKTEQVKQIGNAVPRNMARALVAAILTQDPDVDWLWDDEEAKAAA